MPEETQDGGRASSISAVILEKYTTLKRTFRELEEERLILNERVLELSRQNEELKTEVTESAKVEKWYGTSGVLADREVLRERVRQREERIATLTACLEAQEANIADLTSQLHWVTSSMSAKEALLNKELEELKALEDEKTAHIADLEEKIHRSEVLVQELEKLKQNYRLACATLNENLLAYKTEFKAVVSCSENLLVEKENLVKAMEEKDAQIKKLSIFPQSPQTVVYLSQILHILKESEKSVSDDSESMFSYVPSIRRIIEKMKNEVWNAESFTAIIEMDNTPTQTDAMGRDCFTEYELFLFVEHKYVEVDLPGRFYFECQKLKGVIEKLEGSMSELEAAYYRKDGANRDLEKQLIKAFSDQKKLEKILLDKENEIELAQEKFLILKGELNYQDKLLEQALIELERAEEVQTVAWEKARESLESTLHEYQDHVEVFYNFAGASEERLEVLENCWNEEMERKCHLDSDYLTKVQNEMKNLSEKYQEKKRIIEDLNVEVSKLRIQLSDKTNKFKTIRDKLVLAERLFEEINDSEENSSCNRTRSDRNSTEPAEVVAVQASEVILKYSEKIGDQWKSEMNIKKKLLAESYSDSYVKSLMKTSRTKNHKLRKTIHVLNNNVKKMKKSLRKTRNKMKRTYQLLFSDEKQLDELNSNLKIFVEEKERMSEQIRGKDENIKKFKISLEEKDSKFNLLSYEKEKMEKVLLKIIKDLEVSMVHHEISKESVGTETDLKISEMSEKNQELSSVIGELQARLDSLMNIPEKDSNNKSNASLQTTADLEKRQIKDLQLHYENIIEKLKKDLSKERLLANKRRNEIETSKINNEKEIKRLNLELKKALHQLKEDFSKEKSDLTSNYSKQVKRLNEKIEKLENERKEMSFGQKEYFEKLLEEKDANFEDQYKYFTGLIENKDNQIMEQKKYYEDVIALKDQEVNSEIQELKTEIDNVMSKKEEIIDRTRESCLVHVSKLKKKFKTINRRLRHEKAVLLKKVEVLKERLVKVGLDTSSISLQTENELEKKPRGGEVLFAGEISVADTGCQTLFLSRGVDSSAQSLSQLQLVDVASQTSFGPMRDGPTPNPNRKADHIIFGLPATRKDISINFKERIRCSIQERSGSGLVGSLLQGLTPLSEVRELALHRDKSELASHIAYLETELLKKTEDFNRNVEMYQETIRRQRGKVSELERLLSEEMEDTYELRNRLAVEYNRAERIKLEKKELEDYITNLQRHISDHEIICQAEKAKYNYYKSHFESALSQRSPSEELEETLKRLNEKVDTAVKYEKKLMEELKTDRSGYGPREKSWLEGSNASRPPLGQMSSPPPPSVGTPREPGGEGQRKEADRGS